MKDFVPGKSITHKSESRFKSLQYSRKSPTNDCKTDLLCEHGRRQWIRIIEYVKARIGTNLDPKHIIMARFRIVGNPKHIVLEFECS